jgi:hypothetical protein
MQTFRTLLIFGILLSLLFSCGNNQESATTDADQQKPVEEEPTQTIPTKPFQPRETLYTWVDRLNIRQTPALSGEVVANVAKNVGLEFTGMQAEKLETIVLRGVAYQDTWLKVITPDGKEGWVFGGAVRREGEPKGNGPITDTEFDFPIFGKYDLSEWKKTGERREGEEVDYTITTYRKSGRILEITTSNRGEFFYGTTHKLMNLEKEVLKVRKFDFTADVDLHILSETVTDFTVTPPRAFTRTQRLDQHFYKLNARPLMVNGQWTEKILDPVPDRILLEDFDLQACTAVAANDSGCSCLFGTPDTRKGAAVFVSDLDANACVKVDGEMIALIATGPDYRSGLLAKSKMNPWIAMEKDGTVLIFGEEASMDDYQIHVNTMVDVLLVMDPLPSSIEVENNGYQGMAIREVRDIGNDALVEAREYKAQGSGLTRQRWIYTSDQYKVELLVEKTTDYEGEANAYSGTLKVKAANGRVLLTEMITGYCGC